MSDDISLFHPRMRKPAIIAIVGGIALGFLAVGAHRIRTESTIAWYFAFLYGGLAAIMLYGITYRNLKQRIEYERSQLSDDDGE